MPIYEFICDKCKHEFEIKIAIKDYDITVKQKCPDCHNQQQTRRRFGVPGISFGKGFFRDGYESAKNVKTSTDGD